ncbi:hypothetical protein L1887_62424 [Cichorium endivia]|nr:hypothetical protein L1887_62424 [Cichorium endivia]
MRRVGLPSLVAVQTERQGGDADHLDERARRADASRPGSTAGFGGRALDVSAGLAQAMAMARIRGERRRGEPCPATQRQLSCSAAQRSKKAKPARISINQSVNHSAAPSKNHSLDSAFWFLDPDCIFPSAMSRHHRHSSHREQLQIGPTGEPTVAGLRERERSTQQTAADAANRFGLDWNLRLKKPLSARCLQTTNHPFATMVLA